MHLNGFFKGTKVIELASVLAGPLCGTFFSELGAEVIKVEHPERGDITRSWRLANEDSKHSVSAYYAAANSYKKLVYLDLLNDEDRMTLHTLLKDADILITNFKHGDAQKFGLADAWLAQEYPGLIRASITGFGEESKRVAFDIVLQAETGWISMTGADSNHLARLPVAVIDLMAAHQLKEALLLAYIHKLKTGVGSSVTVSLFDAAVAALTNQATNWLMEQHIAKPQGTLHPNIAPYGDILKAKTGLGMVLAVGNHAQFEKLCKTLLMDDLPLDPRFNSNQQRVTNRAELMRLLNDQGRKMEEEALYQNLLTEGVPVGKIRNLKEVFELEEAKNLLIEETIEKRLCIKTKTNVFKIKHDA